MEAAKPGRLALSPRLGAVAGLVLRGAPMADVGADHGQLGVALLLGCAVPRVLALDLRAAPLAAAGALATRHGLALGATFELRRSDGLAALRPDEVATVVVAGMGGGLIRRLLERAPLLRGAGAPRRLVLQPNLDAWRVRAWAQAAGWDIAEERLVWDAGRPYPVIALEPAASPPRWSEADLRWGPRIRQQQAADLDRALAEEEARLDAVVERLSPSQTAALRRTLAELRAERARIALAADPAATR